MVGLVCTSPSAAATPTSAQKSAAQQWYQHVVTDLQPLQSSLVAGLQSASSWQNGTVTTAAAATAFRTDLASLDVVLGTLEGQTALAGHPASLADYVYAVNLYRQAFTVEETATQLPSGFLVIQLQRSFQRIRELGDLTFDQGTAELAPYLGSAMAGSDVRAAQQIPDWQALHLAPGQPLASSWAGSRTEPSGTQSLSSWAATLRSDHAPSASAVRSAVALPVTSVRQLSTLALHLQQSEDRLDTAREPSGFPQASARQRLGLLIDAEGLLAAEGSDLSGIAPDATLSSVATSLVTIGNDLRASDTAS
jgi:hypothetical protein